MKHFRDLVLSTKEPALHNVLWIKPIGIEKYIVLMYEDGWIPLFGGGGEGSNGLSYEVLESTPDGYIVQFLDVQDPTNPKKLYPKTKALYVTLSNGVTIEEAINNINTKLNNISQLIKKAWFVTQEQLASYPGRANKTFWVYSSYNTDTGLYVGETFIRKYTSADRYEQISLSVADIVMDVRDPDCSMTYVKYFSFAMGGGRTAAIQKVADIADVYTRINNALSNVVTDVLIDGKSVVSSHIANLKKDVRKVYMVTSTVFNTDYPEGNARADKTFLIRIDTDNDIDNTQLRRYTSTGLDASATSITLLSGDLLFNLDDHTVGNSDFIPNTLYVYDTPQENKKVHPIATKSLVDTWVGNSVEQAVDTVKDMYLNFTVAEVHNIQQVNSDYSVAEIYDLFNSNRSLYAVVAQNQGGTTVNQPILTLRYIDLNNCIFSGYSQGYGFTLRGVHSGTDLWTFAEYELLNGPMDTVPTEDSPNAITSGGMFTALGNYVYKSTYNNRMETTPKYHRAEWIEGSQDPDNPGVIPYLGPSTITPIQRFNSMWTAIYSAHATDQTSDTWTPKIILFNGVPCCYSDSLNLNSSGGYETATDFTLKFFDGSTVTTYVVEKATDLDDNIILNVSKTVQNVTLT